MRESNTTGLDSIPSEKATSSGTSRNYTTNAFGIEYTTSTLLKMIVMWSLKK